MPDFKFINFSSENKIAIIAINNPPANALSSKVMEELDDSVDAVLKDDDIKVAIITGTGGVIFVAGADIKEIANIENAAKGQELTAKGQAVLNKIEQSEKPFIVAINGLTLGGGCELAMACHIRIASDMTKFGQPEINLGIIPGFGGTQRLPRLVGSGKAAEIILTGDMVTAKEAHRIGLVDKIVPPDDVLKQAKGIAKRIASKGKLAIAAALKSMNRGLKTPLEEGLRIESEIFGKVCETEDKKEGVSAFLEKRQPKFKDK